MPQGYSLHIGLNSLDPDHYDGWSGPLNACEADAASMEAICRSQGFETRSLLTVAASRDAVIGQIRQAAQRLQPGDTFILSYAGHGAQLPDLNGDEDDTLDETWCLYDGQLLDDELYRLWANFAAGVRIAVFSDSCHSGSVVRDMLRSGDARLTDNQIQIAEDGDSPAIRLMPPEIQLATYTKNRETYDTLLFRPAPPPTPAASVILISGCQDNQLSADGTFNGAFTGALVATWNQGRFDGGYKDFMRAIRGRLPRTQSPNFMSVGSPDPAFERERPFSIAAREARGGSLEADATDCLIRAIAAKTNVQIGAHQLDMLKPSQLDFDDDLAWLSCLDRAADCLRQRGYSLDNLDSAESLFGKTLDRSLEALMAQAGA